MLALPEIKRYISSKIKYEDFVNYWKKIELKKNNKGKNIFFNFRTVFWSL